MPLAWKNVKFSKEVGPDLPGVGDAGRSGRGLLLGQGNSFLAIFLTQEIIPVDSGIMLSSRLIKTLIGFRRDRREAVFLFAVALDALMDGRHVLRRRWFICKPSNSGAKQRR
jgi:hypothetical protein